MKESDLYLPIKEWLEYFGWQCYAEVCATGEPWPVDVVAKRHNSRYLLAIEMKTGFTKHLLEQARELSIFALYPYVAAPTKPREAFIEEAHDIGVGILRVTNGVEVILKPHIRFKDLYWFYWKGVLEELEQFGHFHSTLLAGAPNGKLGIQI